MSRQIPASVLILWLTFPLEFAFPLGAQVPAGSQKPPAGQDPHKDHAGPAAGAREAPQAQQGGRRLRLEDLEKMALESNPTLAQAAAEVRAAEGRKLQAGLYPNPVVGPTAAEISRGPIIRGGEWGGFLEQRIVTAGKLGLNRQIVEQERLQAEATAQAQRFRVLNTIRSLYYEALGAERLINVRSELAKIANVAVKTSRELLNVGQADQPDLLEVEVEAQRADLALTMAKNNKARVWRQLASVVGRSSLEPAPLEGKLEDVPKLELDNALAALLRESPEIRVAEAGIARADASVRRARVEKIPDIVARGGLHYNRELLEQNLRPVGLEGFFDVSIQLPIFNRNQGAVAAARAESERARLEVERVKLSLRARLAAVYNEYQNGLIVVERYQKDMLPRARKAHELYLNSFRQMAAAYPQVLISQRNWFQLEEDYVKSLVGVWRSALEIQGLLLMGGLEAPFAGAGPRDEGAPEGRR